MNLFDLHKMSLLSKPIREVLCNDNIMLWKAAYRQINVSHKEEMNEMYRQIQLKNLEIKSIVPMKTKDLLKITDIESENQIKELLTTYVIDETKVGECIENTMYNTNIFLNDQYKYMQRLYEEEQERIRKEKELAQKKTQEPAKPAGGFASRFLSAFNFKKKEEETIMTKPAKINTIEEPEYENISAEQDMKKGEEYLISTNVQFKPVEETKLIDFDDDNKLDENKPNEQNSAEHEVSVRLEYKDIHDENDGDKTETESIAHNDTLDETQDFSLKEQPKQRNRSDSISSTSTSKIYSQSNFNEFMNVEELNKFLYK